VKIVNMHRAKSELSRLVEEVLAGKEIILARAGKPLVRLIAYEYDQRARRPGRFKGKIRIDPDFDHTPEGVVRAFEGGE